VKLALRLLDSMSQQLRVPVGLLDDLNVDDQILWSKGRRAFDNKWRVSSHQRAKPVA
jgi:hypothetical protein